MCDLSHAVRYWLGQGIHLELRDRIGDPIMIGRFLDFFPIISDARFLSVRSEIGRFFFVCALFMTNTSKFLQINSTKS